MSERPVWFNACIVGAIFSLVVLPTAGSFFMLLVNLIAFGCFVAPVVAIMKEEI